jgi:hypothetical protein
MVVENDLNKFQQNVERDIELSRAVSLILIIYLNFGVRNCAFRMKIDHKRIFTLNG